MVSSPKTLISVSNNIALLFKYILYIYYLINLKKNQVKAQLLINFGSKINAITWSYVNKLGLKICATDVEAQKIDSSIPETFGIILASFPMENKLERVRFFQETFLVADTSIDVILRIFFPILSNANVVFKNQKLTYRS